MLPEIATRQQMLRSGAVMYVAGCILSVVAKSATHGIVSGIGLGGLLLILTGSVLWLRAVLEQEK